MSRAKLLYLGFAFPPGVQALFPEFNATGHLFETQMVSELSRHFEVRCVGTLPVRLEGLTPKPEASVGLPHALTLLDQPPEWLNYWRSFARLKRNYRVWQREGWRPDAVLVYNTAPSYNSFICWLGRHLNPPKRILLLADSNRLGCPLPRLKRLRYCFKPFVVLGEQMLPHFEGCVSLSKSTERFFAARKIPWLWMPGGCNPERALPPTAGPESGPVRFGYFGRLAADPGVPHLVEAFLAGRAPATLHVCGYGGLAADLAQKSRRDERLHFDGDAPTADGYLKFAQTCDVLVNPRPQTPGNENNFPSKLFAYALAGRAILTTGFAGTAEVLGPEAFYLDGKNLAVSLQEQFTRLAAIPRPELRRVGKVLQDRIVDRYSWQQQAAAMAKFIARLE